MVDIKNLVKYNEYLETAANECNIKGIVEHIRIVSKHIGGLEQKRSDRTLKIQESKHLDRETEKLANNINKIRRECICTKK